MGFVDTSALVALERAGATLPGALGVLANEEVVIPAIVVAELLACVLGSFVHHDCTSR